jgi:hypothetical protein
MTDPADPPPPPDSAERAALNAALLAAGVETGFWDDRGRPAPWPDDIDEWTPATMPARLPGEARLQPELEGEVLFRESEGF